MCFAAPDLIALVSGANKGIGKEIARGHAQKGYHVLVGARKKELGEAAAAELAEHGEVSFLQLDVTDPESVIAAAAAVTSKFGHLDVLVGLTARRKSRHGSYHSYAAASADWSKEGFAIRVSFDRHKLLPAAPTAHFLKSQHNAIYFIV